MGSPDLFRALLACSCLQAASAADVKLWQLGTDVEDNPLTVFFMFSFVVGLTILVESARHAIEHRTLDPYRMAGLEAIYIELMLIGIVNFFLILIAELGLTGVRIGTCDADEDSASAACGYGFDIELFQYAHMALFFMGIIYCVYIQICFYWRDRYGHDMKEFHQFTPSSWRMLEMETKGKFAKCKFARKVLVVRAAMCITRASKMRFICARKAHEHELAFAELRGDPAPPGMPPQDQAPEHFNFGKYAKLMYSELLVELIHVPSWVWFVMLGVAAINLVKLADVSLPVTVLVSGFILPIITLGIWWRLEAKFTKLVDLIEEHPDVYKQVYYGAVTHPEVDNKATFQSAGIGDPWKDVTPWERVRGNGSFWYPNEQHYRAGIQVLTFSMCFYMGQLAMLTPLIYEELTALGLLVCWLVPLYPLFYALPRVLLLYTLVFLTSRPTLYNLTKTLRDISPHKILTHDNSHSHSPKHENGSNDSKNQHYANAYDDYDDGIPKDKAMSLLDYEMTQVNSPTGELVISSRNGGGSRRRDQAATQSPRVSHMYTPPAERGLSANEAYGEGVFQAAIHDAQGPPSRGMKGRDLGSESANGDLQSFSSVPHRVHGRAPGTRRTLRGGSVATIKPLTAG